MLDSEQEFARIVAVNGALYVDLDGPTRLWHQKEHDQHRDLEVPAGTWRVVRKTEFDVTTTVDPNSVRYVRD